MTAPVLGELAERAGLTVYTQDDPGFPETVPSREADLDLDVSHRLGIEIVPTLIRFEGGREVARTFGWDRAEWERLTGIAGLGHDLPESQPGCGAKNIEPGVIERLKVRFNETGLKSRRIEIGGDEDEQEAMFARGWSDGLPLVPPTEERVLRMLDGTARDPQEVIGLVPPALAAGDRREDRDQRRDGRLQAGIPAGRAGRGRGRARRVIRDARRAGDDDVCRPGCHRQRAGAPPDRHEREGQRARARATAPTPRSAARLQLVIRNIGEGRPQEVDRATLGNPGKLGYCFAEDEEGSSWEPLSVERGVKPGVSAVTVFAGFGLQGVVDQKSRDPESLARSMAESLKAIHNVKLAPACDALLVVCPEHHRTFANAGWSKARLYEELYRLCEIPGDDLIAGARGIAEGGPQSLAGKTVNKFRPGGLMIVRAGGDAGMFSGIIGGWSAGGPRGSVPVTREVK